MIASGTKKFPLVEEGIHTAVCNWIIGLGMQHNDKFNTSQLKVLIGWQLLDEEVEVNGEMLPRQISRTFSLSLSEKSLLRPFLKGWRGKDFTPEEINAFPVESLLGKGAQIQVIHNTGTNGTYASVENVLPLPKGVKIPKVETKYFDFDEPATYAVFDSLPKYLRNQIYEAENFCDLGIDYDPDQDDQEGTAPSVNTPKQNFNMADYEEVC
ncbi:phage replication initiation protein, NGO0469 family [Massiliimalia massiliensis]|uniref:phage replication initiation protein, NGO0469 family n=1 Tax=Massiliimalia massiliensis TaxID=1852384 RepID=UPI000984A9C4|nr:hypothetical protein [Massiliimalia massiliensis]